MFSHHNHASGSHLLVNESLAAAVGLILLVLYTALPAYAQSTFNSGSTGADGAFAPTANQTVTLPDSGVFNFTTINIPTGVTITFTHNAKNTPVTMLASGDVTINGTITLDGGAASSQGPGVGGPGGFNGGEVGFGVDGFTAGITGDGPGGGGGGSGTTSGQVGGGGGGAGYAVAGSNGGSGNNSGGPGGPAYGTKTLLPPIGGSGGGGGGGSLYGSPSLGGPGGGGGGAILIASSGTITFMGGSISAGGGMGVASNTGSCGEAGGGGSGGAIRLVANTITGTVTLGVPGGAGGGGCVGGGAGAFGFVRIEAYNLNGFTPTVNPNTSAAVSITQPKPAILPNAPQLTIVSVAGIAAPTTPKGSLSGAPDIIIPTAQTNPVSVAIQAANVPVGTIVPVTVTPANGASTTVNSTPLSGTLASSTATANVPLSTAVISVISASATFNINTAQARPMFINGERVDRIEVAAVFGGASQVTYITKSGRRIKKPND